MFPQTPGAAIRPLGFARVARGASAIFDWLRPCRRYWRKCSTMFDDNPVVARWGRLKGHKFDLDEAAAAFKHHEACRIDLDDDGHYYLKAPKLYGVQDGWEFKRTPNRRTDVDHYRTTTRSVGQWSGDQGNEQTAGYDVRKSRFVARFE